MAAPLISSVAAVPRSGWTRTSPAGTRISSKAGTSTVSRRMSSRWALWK